MLQRARSIPMTRRANQLLTMRNNVAAQLGDQYQKSIATYTPHIRAETVHCGGCTITAAQRVLRGLGSLGNDIAVQRLVACAAVELALQPQR